MWSTSFRRTATPMSNLVVFLIIMDKELGEHLNFLYKEYVELSRELRSVKEEVRRLKEERELRERKECKRIMFTCRAQF